LRFAGASRDFAPLNSPKTCFGIIMPTTPTKGSAQNGVGSLNTMRTVWSSTFSTLLRLV